MLISEAELHRNVSFWGCHGSSACTACCETTASHWVLRVAAQGSILIFSTIKCGTATGPHLDWTLERMVIIDRIRGIFSGDFWRWPVLSWRSSHLEAGSLQGVFPNLSNCMFGLHRFWDPRDFTRLHFLPDSPHLLVYFGVSWHLCFFLWIFFAQSCALFSPLHLGCFEERSLTVKFRCGNEELLEVTEPSRCAYEAPMALLWNLIKGPWDWTAKRTLLLKPVSKVHPWFLGPISWCLMYLGLCLPVHLRRLSWSIRQLALQSCYMQSKIRDCEHRWMNYDSLRQLKALSRSELYWDVVRCLRASSGRRSSRWAFHSISVYFSISHARIWYIYI